MAILHRPLFPGTRPEDTAYQPADRAVDRDRESIWISYCPIARKNSGLYHLCHFTSHHRLASPVASWERLKIGGGTPPVLTRHGWLVIYHGVCDSATSSDRSAQVLLLRRGARPLPGASSGDPLSFAGAGADAGIAAGTRGDHRRRGISHRHFQDCPVPISALQTASMCITGWPMTGSAWRALTCRNSCRREPLRPPGTNV